MLIDWFTVIAQVINFLILVWLMKRFLYAPILEAIDAREKKIAAQFADVESMRTEAEQTRQEFERKNAQFDHEHAELIARAKSEAETLRQQLLQEARQSADTFSANLQESLQADARNLNETLIRRAQEEVFAIARQTLQDLAEKSLEDCMVQAFITRLHKSSDSLRSELTNVLTTSSDPVIVRSAFPLSEEQRQSLQASLLKFLPGEIQMQFQSEPELISGVELKVGGVKLAWSIAEYLEELVSGVHEVLNDDRNVKSDRAETDIQSQTESR